MSSQHLITQRRARRDADLARKVRAIADHFGVQCDIDDETLKRSGRNRDARDLLLAEALNVLSDALLKSADIECPPAPEPLSQGDTTFTGPEPAPAPTAAQLHGLRRLVEHEAARLRQDPQVAFAWSDRAGLYEVGIPGPSTTVKVAGGVEVQRPGEPILAAYAEMHRGRPIFYSVESVTAMIERGERVADAETL